MVKENIEELKKRINELENELETYKAGNQLLKHTLDRVRNEKR